MRHHIQVIQHRHQGENAGQNRTEYLNRYQVAYSIPWISSLVLLAAVFILCMTVPVWISVKTAPSIFTRISVCFISA